MTDTTDRPVDAIPLDRELAVAIAGWGDAMPSYVSLTPEVLPFAGAGTAGHSAAGRAALDDGRVQWEDRVVPGPAGAPDITITIVRPTADVTNAPAVYNVHGGGMVMGDRFVGIQALIELAVQHGVVGFSVEYRLAPAHPDPAPVEDCYAGLVWVAEHADELGIDPARLMVLGGSAGGGLAAGVTLLARDRGGPALAGSCLMCPMLDDRDSTVSAVQHERAVAWDRTSNRTGWGALLGDRVGGPDVSVYAAPARATDLSGLPPTFLDVGSAEVFRDEVVDYASRIWAAGGRAELHVWAGGFHGFGIVQDAEVTLASNEARTSWIKRTLQL